jgi:mannose-6-phosphate isomerase-like protein (cupin superfamily)
MGDTPLRNGQVLNLTGLSSSIQDIYSNYAVSEVNESCLRLAVITGEYPWHSHPGSDELFLVLEGELFIDFRDSPTLSLGPMDILTIPAGVVHRTRAVKRTVNLCFEHTNANTVLE